MVTDPYAFERDGLSATPSRIVSVPRVGEARVSFECRLTQIVQLERADGERIQTWMTFGEVVGVHIDRDQIRDGLCDTSAARPILRAGGPADYFDINPANRFHMPPLHHDMLIKPY